MPEEEVAERTQRDREQGSSPSTQAGEFVREEMHHVREGKHGARSRSRLLPLACLRRARGRTAAASETRANLRTGEGAGETRYPKGPRRTAQRTFENRSRGHLKSPRAGGPFGGFACESRPSGPSDGAEAWAAGAPSGGRKSCADQRRNRLEPRCAQSGAHAQFSR